jgi:hypothetical protein
MCFAQCSYRFARRGRLICSIVSTLRQVNEVAGNADLNFFNGLLYDPPACAILFAVIMVDPCNSKVIEDLQEERIKYVQRICGVSDGYGHALGNLWSKASIKGEMSASVA